MSLKTYNEARARRAGSHLVTGCTGGCHFDTVRCGQGGRGLSLWWPYGLRLPDLVYILSFLFIMNITEMIGISLRIVLRFFHDLMFLLCWEIKNSWFLIPVVNKSFINMVLIAQILKPTWHNTISISYATAQPISVSLVNQCGLGGLNDNEYYFDWVMAWWHQTSSHCRYIDAMVHDTLCRHQVNTVTVNPGRVI